MNLAGRVASMRGYVQYQAGPSRHGPAESHGYVAPGADRIGVQQAQAAPYSQPTGS